MCNYCGEETQQSPVKWLDVWGAGVWKGHVHGAHQSDYSPSVKPQHVANWHRGTGMMSPTPAKPQKSARGPR